MQISVTLSEASDQSLLVSFGGPVTEERYNLVLSLFHSLRQNPIRGVINLHPAYCSLLIRFDSLRTTYQDLETLVRQRCGPANQRSVPEPKTVMIPVCYSAEFGPDLDDVARLHSLSTEDVISLHTSGTYTVYFLGFVPGFAYLGMLPEQIATPRLATPRKRVPSGSVGIADRQTGVYPMSTPGGWRLIGRTPTILFEPSRVGMSLLEPGDQVRFQAISQSEFDAFQR